MKGRILDAVIAAGRESRSIALATDLAAGRQLLIDDRGSGGDLTLDAYENTLGPLLVKVDGVSGKPQLPAETFGLWKTGVFVDAGPDTIVSLSPYFGPAFNANPSSPTLAFSAAVIRDDARETTVAVTTAALLFGSGPIELPDVGHTITVGRCGDVRPDWWTNAAVTCRIRSCNRGRPSCRWLRSRHGSGAMIH